METRIGPDHRPLLILDLDETLIRSSLGPPEGPFDYAFPGFHGVRRPHLAPLLDFASIRFDLAVWSSATPDYVDHVVRNVFPDPARLLFVWGRPRCTLRTDPETGETYWLKDLKKVRRLGWPLGRIITVDDKPDSYRRHRGNLVRVAPFEGDPSDTELLRLIPILDWLSQVPDVRKGDTPIL